MTRRTVLFAAAIVVALLATASLYAYVSSVNDRAIANAQPVEVLVAKGLIPAGTSAQDASSKGLLTLSSLPRKSVPAGALSDLNPIKNLVAISDIFPGEVLLNVKFSTPQTTGALTIPGNKIAVSVQLQDPERVAGFVVPGSEVAIFNTYKIDAAGGQPASLEMTRLLLPRVPVIAVGPTTLRTSTVKKDASTTNNAQGDQATTMVTVAVTEQEAEKLVQGTQDGKLYLGLLSDKSSTAGNSRGLDNRNLFN